MALLATATKSARVLGCLSCKPSQKIKRHASEDVRAVFDKLVVAAFKKRGMSEGAAAARALT